MMDSMDKFGWIVVSLALMMLVMQLVRFIFNYFIGG
jgi:hypothetical protein